MTTSEGTANRPLYFKNYMKMKLTIVANNAMWETWGDWLYELTEWFLPEIELDVQLVHTSFPNVPFVPISYKDQYEDLQGEVRVDPVWYDMNILPKAPGADLVLLVINTKQWKGVRARGWRTDNNQGPVQLEIATDPNEVVFYPDGTRSHSFREYARHEILHALYMLTGQPDETHYWWNKGDLRGALKKVDTTRIRLRATILQYISDALRRISLALAKIQQEADAIKRVEIEAAAIPDDDERMPITILAEAIKEHEGWGAPGAVVGGVRFPKGTHSYRNNNPGNLRWSPFQSDNDGYAIFPDYDTGLRALLHQLKLVCEGRSVAYNHAIETNGWQLENCSQMSLSQFFSVYAPSGDQNDPEAYARAVAKRIGAKTTTKMGSFLV